MIFIGTVRDDGSRMDFDYPSDYRKYIQQFAGHEVEVELRKRRSKRSARQNAWLHSFLIAFAEHCGYSLAEFKLVGLVAVFGTTEIMGYTVPAEAHTSTLNTEQFSDLCEWFVQKAAECDFLVLYPEEFKRQKKRRGAGDHTSRSSRRVHAPDRDRDGIELSAAHGEEETRP